MYFYGVSKCISTSYHSCFNVSLICFYPFQICFLVYFDGFTRIFMVFTSNLEFLSKCRGVQQDFETCQFSNAKNILKSLDSKKTFWRENRCKT